MRKFFLLLTLLILGGAFGSWLAWYWTPAKKLNLLLIDKSVVSPDASEHSSLSWLLVHERYVPPSGAYNPTENYFGIIPDGSGGHLLRRLLDFSPRQRAEFADTCDAAYVADTYGVSEKDWREQYPQLGPTTDPDRKLIAGFDAADLEVIEALMKRGRLIIAEFNTFAPPTVDSVRRQTQRLLGVRWSGWVGRSFASLDSSSDQLPRWIVSTYRQANGGSWPFGDDGGIVLANELQQRIAILSIPGDLDVPVPQLHMMKDNENRFGTTASVAYSSWFDIVEPDSSMNVVAYFHISTTQSGDEILRGFGLTNIFPAILERSVDRRVYYFAGDFSRNPVPREYLAHAKGSFALRSLFFDSEDLHSTSTFYWTWYYPMMRRLLLAAATQSHKPGRP